MSPIVKFEYIEPKVVTNFPNMQRLASILAGVGYLSLVAGILFFLLFLYCLGGVDWHIALFISIGCFVEGFMSFVFAEVIKWMLSLKYDTEAMVRELEGIRMTDEAINANLEAKE